MAHLLGSQYCIESLRKDVTDLQLAITDVFSRAGPVEHPSWKYPDKKSHEVDITDLLDLYDFSKVEEDNQVAHIVLLELVIDRMVLLLQAMAKYLEQTLAMGSRKASAFQSASSTSIGLVVKKYWNKMVQVYTVVQQLQSENKSKGRKLDEEESRMRELEQELQQYKTGVGCPSFSGAEMFDSTLSSVSRIEIARDESSRPSQTVETAFVPCEACHRVQHCLREVGSCMNKICESQQLPCSLQKFQSQIEGLEWLTSNDVGRWCAEQNKDLTRINKHFEYLMSTIEPLREDLAKEKEKNEDLEKKIEHSIKEIKSEKNTQTIMQKQFQVKLKELEKQRFDSVNKVQNRNEELEREKRQLEKQLKDLNAELDQQKVAQQRLETTKGHLEKELHKSKTNNEQVNILQQQIDDLKGSLTSFKKRLKETERDLNKEKAKTKSISMHSESVQGKQGSMLQRIDDLDRENEQLREEVAELQDLKEELEERIDRTVNRCSKTEKEHREQKAIAERLVREKDALEQSIQELNDNIKELEKQNEDMKENKKLLIMYPDLNGPVNPDISGTGDIVVDMENQVKANSMRIMVLEEQNGALRNSIAKVLDTQKRGPREMLSNPVPLWRPRSPDDGLTEACPSEGRGDASPDQEYQYEEHVAPTKKEASRRPMSSKQKRENVRQSFTVGKSPVIGSASRKSRPSSGANSSFHAYLKLKSAGMIKPARDPPAAKFKASDYVQEDMFSCKGSNSAGKGRSVKARSITSERTNYQPEEIFTCGKCDKIYNSKRDLEIHNTYCYGGL